MVGSSRVRSTTNSPGDVGENTAVSFAAYNTVHVNSTVVDSVRSRVYGTSVRPSVRPFVRLPQVGYCVKTAKHRITLTTPNDSLWTQ